MINDYLHQKRLSIIATFLVASCLFFTGMRVPDLARPHRPKPSQRAVIESQVKTSEHIVNKSIEFFAIMAKTPELRTILPCRTEFLFVFNSAEVSTLFPNTSRAPPLFLS